MPERAELEARTGELRAQQGAARGRAGAAATRCYADERRLDDEARTIGAHADEVDKKLYSGTISSPRELQAMQADVDMLHAAASPTSKTRSSR